MKVSRRNTALGMGLLAVLVYAVTTGITLLIERSLGNAVAAAPWILIELGPHEFHRPALTELLAGLLQWLGLGFLIGWLLATMFRAPEGVGPKAGRIRWPTQKLSRVFLFLSLLIVGCAETAQETEVIARPGETLVLSFAGVEPADETLPEGASFDPRTGRFEWTPGDAQAGEYVMALVSPIDPSSFVSMTIRRRRGREK